MSLTPIEVILLYEKYDKLSAASSTSLQRDSLRREAPRVQWEVEVFDVSGSFDHEFFDFVLHAKIHLHDPWSWLKGNAHAGEMSLTAYMKGHNLRERLLTVKLVQLLRVEGAVAYHARHFEMNPANLLA